jgi:hypothetical protein
MASLEVDAVVIACSAAAAADRYLLALTHDLQGHCGAQIRLLLFLIDVSRLVLILRISDAQSDPNIYEHFRLNKLHPPLYLFYEI